MSIMFLRKEGTMNPPFFIIEIRIIYSFTLIKLYDSSKDFDLECIYSCSYSSNCDTLDRMFMSAIVIIHEFDF